jgi:Protein of unknown function (DUF5663)
MLKIDNSLLEEVGLAGLPDTEKNSFLKHIYETLEMRVGIRLADQMSNEQLDEFERYFEAKDDAGAFKWLETNFPNYKDIVQEEFDKLKAEIAQSAPQILSASASAPQVPAPADPLNVPQQPVANNAMPMQPPQSPVVAGPVPQPQTYAQPVDPQQQVVQTNPAPMDPAQVFQQQPPAAPPYPTQQPPAGPQ